MNKISKQDQDKHNNSAKELIQSQQTLLLSTVSEHGVPESSYAPYVRGQQGAFYIFVSDLATHTKNMLHNSKVSILFIRAEKETQNLFARERMVFACTISEIQQDDKRFNNLLQQMKDKFGETVDLLRSLNDFHLLALTPVSGRYIAGFGQAFLIDIKDGSLIFDS